MTSDQPLTSVSTTPSGTLFVRILSYTGFHLAYIERIQALFGQKDLLDAENGKNQPRRPEPHQRPTSHYFWLQELFHQSILSQTKLIFIDILLVPNSFTTCFAENNILAVANDLWQTTPTNYTVSKCCFQEFLPTEPTAELTWKLDDWPTYQTLISTYNEISWTLLHSRAMSPANWPKTTTVSF